MALIAALATAGILLIAVVVLVLAQRPLPDVMPAQEQAAGNQASNVGSDVTGERTLKFWIELLAIGKTFDSLIFEPPVSPAAAEKNFRSFSDAIRAGGQKIERLLSESTDVDPELVSITQQIRDQSIEVGDIISEMADLIHDRPLSDEGAYNTRYWQFSARIQAMGPRLEQLVEEREILRKKLCSRYGIKLQPFPRVDLPGVSGENVASLSGNPQRVTAQLSVEALATKQYCEGMHSSLHDTLRPFPGDQVGAGALILAMNAVRSWEEPGSRAGRGVGEPGLAVAA